MTGIYGIHNTVNNKWYVGQSKDIEKRNHIELRNLKNGFFHYGNENIHIVSAWQKYGEDAFEWVVLEECTIEQLDEREIFWIAQKDSYKNGYNRTLGGGGSRGVVVSEETRKKMSIIAKNRDASIIEKMRKTLTGKYVGEKSARYGTKHTDKTKQKISKSRTGKCLGVENPFYGKHHSEETKTKLSEIAKNRSEETREKLGVARRKKVYCFETNTIYKSITEASKVLKLSKSHISAVCLGKEKHTKNYHFEFV